MDTCIQPALITYFNNTSYLGHFLRKILSSHSKKGWFTFYIVFFSKFSYCYLSFPDHFGFQPHVCIAIYHMQNQLIFCQELLDFPNFLSAVQALSTGTRHSTDQINVFWSVQILTTWMLEFTLFVLQQTFIDMVTAGMVPPTWIEMRLRNKYVVSLKGSDRGCTNRYSV